MRVPHVLILFATAIASTTPTAAQNNSGAQTRTWISEGYRIRIDAPHGWRLVENPQQIVPDSVVALTNGEVFAAVIPERVPNAPLAEFANLILVGSELSDAATTRMEPIEAYGLPAYRLEYSGTAMGLELTFGNTIVRNGDFVIQFICWTSSERELGPSCRPFEGSVSVLEGEMVGEAIATTTPDTQGAGWTVRNNRFDSVPHRVSVTPPEGWRLLVGQELEGAWEDALVGLYHPLREVYSVAVSYPLRAEEGRDDLIAQVREEFLASLEWTNSPEAGTATPFGRSTPVVFGSLTFEEFSPSAGVSIVAHEERAFLQFAWTLSQGEEAHAAIAEAMSALRPVASDATPSPTWNPAVAKSFSLLAGRYADFSHEFQWTLPGECWIFDPSLDAAREQSDLSFENPCLGVSGLFWAARREETTGRESIEEMVVDFHEDVDLEETLKTTVLATSEAGAESSATDTRLSVIVGDPSTPNLIALRKLADGREFWLSVDGDADSVLQNRETIEGLLDEIEPSSNQPKMSFGEGLYRDHRMRFSIQGPADWLFNPQFDESVASIGSTIQWTQGNRTLQGLAMWSPVPEELLGMVEGNIRSYMANLEQYNAEPTIVASEIGEGEHRVPARRITWVGDTEITDVYFAEVGGVVFTLIGSRLGNDDAEWLHTAAKSFRTEL